MRIKDFKRICSKTEHGIDKFLKLDNSEGKHWEQSKYAPVISSLKVKKYDVEKAIDVALANVTKMCKILSSLNNARILFSDTGVVDITKQKNYYSLRNDLDIQETRYMKQRTEKWHTLRKEGLVTGSTCNNAAGLGKLKDQQAHFDKSVLW